MNLDPLLELAVARSASDVLLVPNHPASLRIDGTLGFVDDQKLSAETTRAAIEQVLDRPQLERLANTRTFDFAFQRHGRRFRGSAFHVSGDPGLALRLLPDAIPTPEKLGLPAALLEFVRRPQGLILFTGATGQGKTTAQAALLGYLNREVACHIVTVEDPIEYRHQMVKAVIDQRELGLDFASMSEVGRHIARQRPDAVMIGELRDAASTTASLTLAETGHLVMTTLHAGDAVQAVARLAATLGSVEQTMVRAQVASVLLAVVNLRLVQGVSGKQVLAAELLVNTPSVSKLIRDGHPEQIYSVMELEQHAGSQTMNHALEALVRAGKITPREAQRHLIHHESRPDLPKARRT